MQDNPLAAGRKQYSHPFPKHRSEWRGARTGRVVGIGGAEPFDVHPTIGRPFFENRMVGVEIKAGSTVTADDFKDLRKLRDSVGADLAAGVVLDDGEAVAGLGDRLHAVPVSQLWENG